MNASLRLLMVTAIAGALASPALAEERQTSPGDQKAESGAAATTTSAPSPTMKDLLADGYEVKAVSIIPHDIVKRGGSTTDVDAAMFFMEKGAQVATCYTDFQSYANGSFYTLACTEYK